MPDVQQDSVAILTPLMIPEAQHLDVQGFQEFFPCQIVLSLARQPMSKPVQLDREFCLGTKEVQHVTCNRMLPSKFKSGETPCPQTLPELFFFDGLFATQTADVGDLVHMDKLKKGQAEVKRFKRVELVGELMQKFHARRSIGPLSLKPSPLGGEREAANGATQNLKLL